MSTLRVRILKLVVSMMALFRPPVPPPITMMISSGSLEHRRTSLSSPGFSGPWAMPSRINSLRGRVAFSMR